MVRVEDALEVADRAVVLQVHFAVFRERVALFLQSLAAPIDMNLLERRLSGNGRPRNSRRRDDTKGYSDA
jgi:hypothetical protein